MTKLLTIRTLLFERLRAQLWLKLALTIPLNLWIYLPYQFFQNNHFFETRVMTPSALDRAIPFLEWAAWPYVSLYLFMPIAPYLMRRRSDIWRYAVGIVLIGLGADFIFFFWPTICVRPSDPNASFLYRTIATLDNPYNAFPSLHAALAVFAALCGELVCNQLKARPIWRYLFWIWTLAILLATIATRQHVTLDLLAGSALAVAVYALVFGEVHKRFQPQPRLGPAQPQETL